MEVKDEEKVTTELSGETPVETAETQPESEQELVDITEASTEDLDAALAEAQKVEAQGGKYFDILRGQSSENLDNGAKGEQSQTAQADGQGANPPTSTRTYSEEEVQGILADKQRIEANKNEKELFIQKQANEIGQLRKTATERAQALQSLKARLLEGLDDKFEENPVQALEDRDQIGKINAELAAIDEHTHRIDRMHEAQTMFFRNVNTEKIGLEDVANLLTADGVPQEYVSQFKQNPWNFTTPEALVELGKRAELRNEFTTADNDRRLLARHVLNLNAEIERLKQRPGQVLNRVQQHLNQAPSVTASTPTVSNQGLGHLDRTQMSTQELDAVLAKYTSSSLQ